MIYETKYGKVILEFIEDGILLKSDVPFKKVKRVFKNEEVEQAKKEFFALKNEIRRIIKEMEEERVRVETEKTNLFKQLKTLVTKGFKKILLYGPTGTGKTHTLLELAKDLKKRGKIDDYLLFTCSSGMEDIDFLGKFIPDGKGALKFEESLFLKFLRKAGKKKILIILDEFNRASSRALNILIPVLDEKNGYVRVNNFINGEIIKAPAENVMFFLSANFGGSYVGTHQIDEAILNRIEVSLFVDYQEEVEKSICSSLPEEKLKFTLELKEFLRKLYKENAIHPFSTRDLKTLVELMRMGDISFETISPVIYKLLKQDSLGYPDEEIVDSVKEFVEKYQEGNV